MTKKAKKEVSVDKFRTNLADHLHEVTTGIEPVVIITKHGEPILFLAPIALLEKLEDVVTIRKKQKKEVPVDKFRTNLAEHLNEVTTGAEPVVVITKFGDPIAFLAPIAHLEKLEDAVPLRSDTVTRLIQKTQRKAAQSK
jgi:prevent-host-death family protein